ncbi:Hsp20/alpha crystallin family protein [Kribbella jejuensis]|uniref:Heat shock protein Hsp20 n=1 Tax=Kribbella jejuensis TaxID=236068 RepID=A0A542EV76_9ACTN|nr:Hsp20/alpha crystallin family protein [Kribbella jejuensis]TQJ19258.1 heat shock protein Hsp20 [Kribbella jejuensis]
MKKPSALPTLRRSRNHLSEPAGTDSRPVRWLPSELAADFEDIWRRMDQLAQSFGTIDRSGWSSFPVDLEETDDAYIVEIDLPGVSPDDLTLESSDRRLTVHGEVKHRERKGFLRQQTRRVGEFHHSITLPGDVVTDQITADLKDGVLIIRAPKPATARSRRIQITTGTPRT